MQVESRAEKTPGDDRSAGAEGEFPPDTEASYMEAYAERTGSTSTEWGRVQFQFHAERK